MSITRRSGPVKGLQVVLLPRQMAVKVMGMILADMGATVVEVVPAGFEAEPGWELAEQFWRRGKVLVEQSSPEALAALVAAADVFATDLHTAELTDLELLPDDLVKDRSDLVCLRVTGYGASSRHEADVWSDTLVMSAMGFPWMPQGDREGAKMPSFPAGSYATVFNGISGIMAALHERHVRGVGQVVETAIFDGYASQQPMGWFWSERDNDGRAAADIAAGGMGRLVLASYRCADGEWIHVHTGARGAFTRLMQVAGLDDRITPIPTQGLSEIGQPITPEELQLIHAELPRMFASNDRAHWLGVLRGNGIPTMPDLRPGECFVDPHVLENQLTTLRELPSGEDVRGAGVVLKYSETPGLAGEIAPRAVSAAEALLELGAGAATRAGVSDTRGGSARSSGGGASTDHLPLAGLKVLDFGIYFAGPYASRLLGDLGAQVIKVENPAGCPMRAISRGRYFNAANRDKRSLAIDLKHPDSRPIVERLVKSADVFHHNLRPGTAENLGIGYADLTAINPRLIYCHSPGFGLLGPYRNLPAFEPLSSAITGLLMRREGCQESGPQAAIGSMDPGNGMLGAAGILMALYHRDRTGEPQFVECPQMGSAILSTPETLIRGDGSIADPCLVDRDQYGFAWWKRLYRARDGWLVVDCFRETMRGALLALVQADEPTAAADVARWAADRSIDAALGELRSAGIACEAVGEAFAGERFFFEAENLALGRVVEYRDHPAWGSYRDLGGYWRMSNHAQPFERDYSPAVGEHTREILAEHGLGSAEIEALFRDNVVFGR